jgi:hypothetical protein
LVFDTVEASPNSRFFAWEFAGELLLVILFPEGEKSVLVFNLFFVFFPSKMFIGEEKHHSPLGSVYLLISFCSYLAGLGRNIA